MILSKFCQVKLNMFLLIFSAVIISAIASCSSSSLTAQKETVITQNNSSQSDQWRQMTQLEKEQAWQYILNNPLGIAALNQLAIEGFISPTCPKSFYTNPEYGGFQFLLRVNCPTERGVSSALGYDEMRVIFNRFEDNIESFQIERVSEEEGTSVTPLPDE